MPKDKIGALTVLYASKQLNVSFLGPAYLASRKAELMPPPVMIAPAKPGK